MERNNDFPKEHNYIDNYYLDKCPLVSFYGKCTAFETYKTRMDQFNIFSRHGLSSSAQQFLKVHETQDKNFNILLKCKECSNIDKCLLSLHWSSIPILIVIWSLSGITVITTKAVLKINHESVNASNFWKQRQILFVFFIVKQLFLYRPLTIIGI